MEGQRLSRKEKYQIEEGWRKVLNPKDNEDEPHFQLLAEGEQGTVVKVEVKESKTQPPKRYTEGQLDYVNENGR